MPLMSTAVALVAALASSQLPGWMTGQSRGDELAISLVTFGPGDTLTEWWGHTALVVEDVRLQEGRLYNFGMFSFSSGFLDRFAKGRLEFWVDDAPIRGTFELYRTLNRDVRIQELNLTGPQALSMARALGTHVLPENRTYLYDHYKDNCSTRPRDIIDAALGGQLKEATKGPGRMTLRQLAFRYALVNPPVSLFLDYLQNDELDRPITQQQEAFLPDELERQVQALRVTRDDGQRVALVKRQWSWFEANRPKVPPVAPQWIPMLLVLGVGVAAFAHLLGWLERGTVRRWPRVALGLLHAMLGLGLGVAGVALFGMGLLTDHSVTHRNENLFLVSPLTLAIHPLGFMLMAGSKRARSGLFYVWSALAALSIAGVALKVLPNFDQANWNLIALFVPVNVGFAWLFWLGRADRARRNKAISGSQQRSSS